ncbi:MAG: restriction endonuclease subunit S [Phormidesmis sp. RL_2_1]|nr:restriction endonuclease subunit S [Phormidesmis sp. RL_2_1]
MAKCLVGEIITLQRGFDITRQQQSFGHYPVVSSSGIKSYHNEWKVEGPGVVIGRKGSLGTVFYIAHNFWPHDTTLWVKDFHGNSPSFVHYFLKDFDLGRYDVGSSNPTLNRNHVHLLAALLPPLPEQQAIAQVLSSLDDKIDLLHRQNKTLEAIAETLFRQWFIEEAQDNWKKKSLLDIIQVINGGTPKTSVPEYWNGDIPWLSGGDIASSHKSFVLSSAKTISQDGLDYSSAKLLPKFATVITARGTVGKYALLSKPIAYSQSNFGILPGIEGCFFFTYLLINHVVRELQSAAYGSVFDTITATTFKEIEVAVPSVKKIEEFEKSISPYFFKKLHCLAQIQTLEKLRDTLLPKLMSGEVRVEL